MRLLHSVLQFLVQYSREEDHHDESFDIGARGRTRTGTLLRARDLKSLVSAISPPGHRLIQNAKIKVQNDNVKLGVVSEIASPSLAMTISEIFYLLSVILIFDI